MQLSETRRKAPCNRLEEGARNGVSLDLLEKAAIHSFDTDVQEDKGGPLPLMLGSIRPGISGATSA